MQNELVKIFANSVPVRQILTKTSEWIHVLASDQSHYLMPAVPRNYFYKNAYCDSIILSALGITTLDAEVLSVSEHLSDVCFKTGDGSRIVSDKVVGWRLPEEKQGDRLLQVLPLSWLKRVANREQFLEVLILDLWFRRSGQRQVVFRQTGSDIEAIFLPSGHLNGTQKCTVQQVGYYQSTVYNGLPWASIEVNLKARIASLALSDLGRRLRALPQIVQGHEVLKSLWFETLVNKACFDKHFTDAMGALFGGVVYRNNEDTSEIYLNRLRAVTNSSRGYALGGHCS